MKGLKFAVAEKQNKGSFDSIAAIFVCAILVSGYVKSLLSAFPSIEKYWWIFSVAYAETAVLLTVLKDWKHKNKCFIAVFAAIIGVTLLNISAFINGICVLLNDIIIWLTEKTGRIYLDFPANGTKGVMLATAIVMLIVTVVLCWAVNSRITAVVAIFSAICFAGCAVGLFTVDYGVIVVFAGTIVFFAYKNCRINSFKSFFYTNTAVIATTIVCFVIGISVCYALNFDISFDHKVRSIKNTIHENKYHTVVSSMPEGDLVNIGAFEKNGETALIVSAQTPQKFYLRGMTGEIYTGSSWESFDENIYAENEALFYWLHKLDFYGQTVISNATGVVSRMQTSTMKLTNVSACKEHTYLPYAVCNNDVLSKESIADGTVYTDLTELELEYYEGSLPQWYQTALWLSENQKNKDVKEYLQKEETYREFVYKNNLQLTNTAVGALEQIFGDDQNTEKSLSEILKLVIKTVNEHIEYSEKVVTENGKNDFVSYTLQQSKSGYSPHYATVATLMLRYMGVPARYVEGYYISAEEVAEYAPYEDIHLTQAHAHCWAEYYMDGVGWLPFEVTPGYIDQEELDETTIVVADGMGLGNSKEFKQSQLKYTPPKIPEDKSSLPDLRGVFRFQTKQIVATAVIIASLAAVIFTAWVIRRALKLKNFLKNTKHTSNSQAVTDLFGYASMLIERFSLPLQHNYGDIQTINKEARFSNHTIDEQKRDKVEKFAADVVNQCKEKHNLWQKIKYRFILWLY